MACILGPFSRKGFFFFTLLFQNGLNKDWTAFPNNFENEFCVYGVVCVVLMVILNMYDFCLFLLGLKGLNSIFW